MELRDLPALNATLNATAFVLLLIGVFALAAVALYWLAVARLQQRAHALAPAADELHDFWVALALAVAGQGAGERKFGEALGQRHHCRHRQCR